MSDTTNKGGAFDALLDEIETMARRTAEEGATKDDEKIAAAAGEAPVAGDDAAAKDGDEDADGEEDGKPFAKSFEITLEDGTTAQAIDGTELVKSLIGRVEVNETTLAKALTTVVGLLNSQGALLKAQGDEIAALKSAGKGRKTVLAITEKPAPAAETMAKSEGAAGGISGEEFLAKALTAQAEGKISGAQVALSEQYINTGQTPPADIVRAVLG